MINGENNCTSTAANPEPVSDDQPTPATSRWLSRTAKSTAGSVYDTLRRIPNPIKFLFAIPGTLLELSGRGLSCAPAKPHSRIRPPAVEPGALSAATLPNPPSPTESARTAELNDQHNPHSYDTVTDRESSRYHRDDIISGQKHEPKGGDGTA